MHNVMNQIQTEVSKKRLYDTVKEVSVYHRIQASTGFREAANFVSNKLTKMGIENRVLSFEANENQWYLQQRMFQEWDCKDAWLNIEGMGKVCDFTEEAQSVIQKSYPADYSNTPVEIVDITDTNPEALKTMDLSRKMLFVHFHPRNSLNLIKETGAIGFISDFIMEVDPIRYRADAYDTNNYTSFWWKHTEDEPKTFGFCLTPRQGDQLKKKCAEGKVTCTFKIDSAVYPGHMEVVEGVVHGETDDEIIVSAHLCHPKACANDNASGVAGAIETLRTLKYLQDTGKIKLKKTVRMLLIPEMTGTYCYLSTLDNYDHIKGAINMDMVGGKQDGTYGPITVTSINQTLGSPLNSIAQLALNYAREQIRCFGGKKVPLVASAIEAYTGGSDHTIFCDQTINAPCIMLGQWPDKYYHTSSDTLECVDPNVLKFSTTYAAIYVYALSNFDEAMHKEALVEHAKQCMDALKDIAETESEVSKATRGEATINYYLNSTENYKVFGDVDTSKDKAYIEAIAKIHADYYGLTGETEVFHCDCCDYVPSRNFVGPLESLDSHVIIHPEYAPFVNEFNEYTKPLGWGARGVLGYALNYMDGKRTLNEIIHLTECETGKKNSELIIKYFDLLKKMNLVK